jgi:hypothetical protein
MEAPARYAAFTIVRRYVRLGLATAGLAVVGGVFTNCNAVIGAGDYGVCPAPGLADWYADNCASCVNANCCAAAQACTADSTCVDRQDCLHACTFPSCALDSCGVQIVKTVHNAMTVSPNTAGSLDDCISQSCSTECADWSCLGTVAQPQMGPGDVELTVNAVEFANLDTRANPIPIRDMSVFVCGEDSGDAGPPGETCPKDAAMTGAQGRAVVRVPSGFSGYLKVTGKVSVRGVLKDVFPTLVYLSWPIVSNTTYALELITPEAYNQLQGIAGGGAVSNSGGIVVFTEDCAGNLVPGVTLSIEVGFGHPLPYYFQNGVPAPSCQSATTVDGVGGFGNVLEGLPYITARLATPDGRPGPVIGTTPVRVLADALTYVWLAPRPPN